MSGRVRFEVIASLILVALLFGLLVERLLYYEEYAEKTVVELTITNMGASLMLRKAELMMAVAQGTAPPAFADNPVTWLPTPLPNYAGEFAGMASASIGAGVWYFDTTRRELAYRPKLTRHFAPDSAGNREVRIKAVRRLAGQPERPVGAAGGTGNAPWRGTALVLASPYAWFASL